MFIQVKELKSGLTHTIDIEGDFTIIRVKELVRDKFGVPLGQIELAFGGSTLSNNKRINDYQISKEDMLFLINSEAPPPCDCAGLCRII